MMKTLAVIVTLWTQVVGPGPAENPQRANSGAGEGSGDKTAHLSASVLSQAWRRLVAGEIKGISIDAGPSGELTLALYDETGQLSVIKRRASGNWSRTWSTRAYAAAEPIKLAPPILARDLNGDGACEILIYSDRLYVLAEAQSGFELAWQSAETPAPEPVEPRQIGVADFNADGRADVALVNYNGKKIAFGDSLLVYLQNASSTLEFELHASTSLKDEHGYHSTAGLAVGDFNADGRAEIVVGNDNGFLWLAAFEEGRLSIRNPWKVAGGAVYSGLCAGELDGDRGAELLVGTNGGDIHVYDFDHNLEPLLTASVMTGRLAYGVASGDVDGDGREEFILGRGQIGYAGMTQDDVVAEVWQLRGKALRRAWRLPTISSPRPLAADVDGDGRAEIIMRSAAAPGLWVLEPRW